ncbi:unnamed protein product [Alopecurus aequalis]
MAHEPTVLPEDIVVEVLRRLPPHNLAASRWVCKAWRDIIDDHLRSQLLSHSVRGIFINYTTHTMSEFFTRPSAGPALCGGFDWLPCQGVRVTDHCNGLLLCTDWKHDYVVNPATRRWTRLPLRPPPHVPGFGQAAYLTFDHVVSPHFEVYLIPQVPCVGAATLLQTEWPPASHVMHVFSSMTKRWDTKTFIREGVSGDMASGLFGDMASGPSWDGRNRAVYWQGALYVHDQCGSAGDFVMRMCLSNSMYQVIKMPDPLGFHPRHHLGRSMRGLYRALSHSSYGLQFWHLDESCGQIKWVLKHDRRFHLRGDYAQHMDKHWILQDVNYRKGSFFEGDRRTYGNYDQALVEEKYEWDSDDDNIILDSEYVGREKWEAERVGFLGFHPYKEVVFLTNKCNKAVAYDWNTSKFQYLGPTLPKHYEELTMQYKGIVTYFPYTPCWMYELQTINSESQLEDEQLSGKSLENLGQK